MALRARRPGWLFEAGHVNAIFQKLARQKALSIVYFGGSITDGVGASDAEKTSWRALMTGWFRRNFPDADIRSRNASMRGTGSELGAFRVAEHCLSHRPDLVFVEFAVNDWRLPEAEILRYSEGIARQLRRAESQPDLIFVYATMKRLAKLYPGTLPPSVTAHRCVAAHYEITEINAGASMLRAIEANSLTWNQLTIDGVHPTNAGHAFYAGEIARVLESHHKRAVRPQPPLALPAPLSPDSIERGSLVDAWPFGGAPGWRREALPVGDFISRRIASDVPGAEIEFPFRGRAIGMIWLVAADSGDVEWSVDGGDLRKVSGWQCYAMKSTRAHGLIFANDLPDGSHLLRLRVSPQRHPRSSGAWIRIGKFLTNEPPMQTAPLTPGGNAIC